MCGKVTVGVPTYNRKKYLREALDSIVSQDYNDLEIVISDNHSTDGTEEMVMQYILNNPRVDIKYYRLRKNLGHLPNWENCWARGTGEYMLILSDDDILQPGAISNMVAAFDEEIVEVIGDIIVINSDGICISRMKNHPNKYSSKEFWYERLNGDMHDTPSAVMFRYDLGYKAFLGAKGAGSAMDIATSLLISEYGYVRCIDYPVVSYRVHEGNDTNNVLRCASSHVCFYRLFKEREIENNKLTWLQGYCVRTIIWYARKALKSKNMILTKRCLLLIDSDMDMNSINNWMRLLRGYVQRGIRYLIG